MMDLVSGFIYRMEKKCPGKVKTGTFKHLSSIKLVNVISTYMKSFIVSIFLLLPLLIFSQVKLHDTDPKSDYALALDKFREGDSREALRLLRSINENDSIFRIAAETMASIMLNDEDYEQLINFCDSIMRHFTDYSPGLIISKGVAQLRMEDNAGAIRTFEDALTIFPMSYLMHYNLALANERIGDFPTSIQLYKKTITLNPYYERPHLQLARLAYRENLITQAVLAWDTYLLLSPRSEDALNVLSELNNAVSIKNESEPLNINLSEDDGSFDEIDLIVNNYAALNENYKIDNKIALAVVKQNHAIMEKLDDFEGGGGFWDVKYVAFYKSLYSQGYFNDFIYRILASVTTEPYQKIISKNSGKQDEFVLWAANSLTGIMGKENSDLWGHPVDDFQYLANGTLSAAGMEDAEGSSTGRYTFYYEDGSILSTGYFSDDARDRDWVWYTDPGVMESKAGYKNNLFSGSFTQYHSNGIVKKEGTYKNDYFDGIIRNYNIFGALTGAITYREGILHGKSTTYYAIGKDFKELELNYTEDEPDGDIYKFFPNGSLQTEITFDKGKKIAEKHYFENKELSYLYHYEDGKLNGEYLSRYENGNVHSSGQFIANNKTGTWKYYSVSGVLVREENFNDKGIQEGIYKEFTPNGKPYLEYEYIKGDLVAYKFVDDQGKILVNERKQNKKFNYRGHHSNGVLSTEGIYRVEGGKEGEWNYFDVYGNLLSRENYAGGLQTGADEQYFSNGSLETRYQVKEGVQHGYFEDYYITGIMARQGYVKNDLKDRVWLTYYPDGTLEFRNYYASNEYEGFQYEYAVEGHIKEMHFCTSGSKLYTVYYDAAGRTTDTLDFVRDSIKTFYYANGKPKSTQHYLHGYAHGNFIWYHYNGLKATEGDCFFGDRHGIWKWYDDKGNLTSETTYRYGVLEGKTYYHSNGNLSSVIPYENGSIHGWYVSFSESGDTVYKGWHEYGDEHGINLYYSDEGELQMARYYRYGELYGYSYPDSEGNLVDLITLEKGTGKVEAFYQNGKRSRVINFEGGDFSGTYLEYYSNGDLTKSTEYLADIRNGKVLEFFPGNKPKSEANYLNGSLHGPYTEYHANGNVAGEMNYLNNKLSGDAKYYDSKGKLTRKLYYTDGEVYYAENF